MCNQWVLNLEIGPLTTSQAVGAGVLRGCVGNRLSIAGDTPTIVILQQTLNGRVGPVSTTPGNKLSGRSMGQGVLPRGHTLICGQTDLFSKWHCARLSILLLGLTLARSSVLNTDLVSRALRPNQMASCGIGLVICAANRTSFGLVTFTTLGGTFGHLRGDEE